MTEITGSLANSPDIGKMNGGGMESMCLSIRSEVIAQVQQVANEQEKQLRPLVDDLSLMDSGLDSLCFAIIVARLENLLGIDPFSTAEDNEFPVTFGDFIRFYENAAK